MPNRCASVSIRRRFPIGNCCKYFSAWRTIPPSSTAKARIAGSQYRSAIFYTSVGATADRARLSSGSSPRTRIPDTHRHAGRAAAAVLSGRRASPELSGAASLSAIYRLQRHAQAGAIAQTISGFVSMTVLFPDLANQATVLLLTR